MNKRIKTLVALLFILAFLFRIAPISYSESNSKLLILSSDSIGISDINSIKESNEKVSSGLLSLKSTNRNEENIFINMAYGRTYGYSENNLNKIDFGSVISAKSYSEIMKLLEKEYAETNKDVKSLGEILKANGIKRSFIGSSEGKNNKSYIFLSDSDGMYDFGYDLKNLANSEENTSVNEKMNLSENQEEILKKEISEQLKKSDIVMVSLSEFDKNRQIKFAKDFMSSNSDYSTILMSTQKPDYGYMENKSISLILVTDNQWDGNLLTSDSTKREGLVSSLDLKSTVLKNYGLNEENSTGKPIQAIDTDQDVEGLLKENLKSYLNLNLVKYVFHGLIIGINFLVIVFYLFRKNIEDKLSISYLPPAFVLFSVALYFLNGNIILYAIAITVSSIALVLFNRRGHRVQKTENYEHHINNELESKYKNGLSSRTEKEVTSKPDYMDYVPFITNILILIGIFFMKNMIYGSFIGYNNIDAGGRYYGFNNDIMGVLIGTGLISAGMLNSKVKSTMSKYIGFAFILINLVSLTGNFGSNFGGMLTAVVAVGLYVYCFIFRNITGMKKAAVMAFVFISSAIVFYMLGGSSSHFAEFFNRVIELGFVEFFDMIKKKVTQLVHIAIMPPWSVMIILQSVYIIKRLKTSINRKSTKLLKIIFITSIAALMLNDTGAIAFVYMNTYSIALIRYYEERGYFLNGSKKCD